ncbi:DUF2971 domain-containing protein [Geomesophilobacter sediminis]|uniref:DUF2971 domain-containing protein n=1 Tax=Geomesophilobacter sediminis TaxID=2798584 RepID=A0A8J7S888_9BACT|nr:DUF2971 domain-containing protein [Geomesophilobacter sediminis]MBJ6727511.1 DUF2971 domain-containing protein [Geomesophilobacter sediminis]
MILYKYLSYESGLKILQNNSIGFSQPNHFNDPFELEAAYPSEKKANDPIHSIFYGLQIWGKKMTWKRNTGILSLTRQPLNPLMWAHYCGNHTGMVIGIDSAINEFASEEINTIPVQYGSVIYTDKKPTNLLLSKPKSTLEVGGTFHFQPEHLERLQRLFLFKPMCWSYEEEVRVVKCLKGIEKNKNILSGSFSELDVCGRPLYLLKLPHGAIKEVYAGLRTNVFESEEHCDNFVSMVTGYQPGTRVFGCSISDSSWSLKRVALDED